MKHLEKILNCNYKKMLHAIFNTAWKQHPTKQQLYSYLPPISQIIQVRYAGHYKRSKNKLISIILLQIPTHGNISVGWPVKTYIYQFCLDTGSCLENLPSVMTDRDEWQERVKGNPCCQHTLMISHTHTHTDIGQERHCSKQVWIPVTQLNTLSDKYS